MDLPVLFVELTRMVVENRGAEILTLGFGIQGTLKTKSHDPEKITRVVKNTDVYYRSIEICGLYTQSHPSRGGPR